MQKISMANAVMRSKEKNMFLKSEKKRSSAPLFMAVGALAALGAWCVFTKGR